MDDEQKRAAQREAQRRYKERLKQDQDKFAAARSRRRELQMASYWANHEKRLRQQRAYVEANRELVYARNRAYWLKNREKIRARQHDAYVRNLEENRARDRQRRRESYAQNPQPHLDYMKRWRAANPERARAYVRLSGHRRRAAAGGEFIRVEDWMALLEKYNGCCAYCGVGSGPIEADHRIPLSRGGWNTIANIVPACKSCNRRKHTKTEDEFRAWLVAHPTESVRATGSGTPDASAEATGPYRTIP